MQRVTVVIVNYKTLDLTRACVQSVLTTYPGIRMVLVDNGSKDDSTTYIRMMSEKSSRIECILNEQNLTHGPALHQGVLAAKTSYVLTLDSDCLVKRGSFLRDMLRMFSRDPHLYAVGQRDLVNNNGVARTDVDRSTFIWHVHPSAMLLDREKYLQLPPFEQHCAPAVANMRAVPKHNWKLANFRIALYIRHLRGGTRRQFTGSWNPARPLPSRKRPLREVPKEFIPLVALEASAVAARGSVTLILIPTYNAVEHLRRCVQALRQNTRVPYDLYIADAGSPSPVLHAYLDELERTGLATVLRSPMRKDFPTINNWAMQQLPVGVDTCLLNSDTEPSGGWLTSLLRELEADASVGIVGARLVYPEHKGKQRETIQHAGVARTAQGVPHHIFRGEPANCARANKRREVNAVTAACMLVRRALWDQLEGFDETFVGGQFEDVDFCWRARAAGWKIVYQPEAMLYHFEHGSGRAFVQQASQRNRQKLMDKWPGMSSDEYLFK